ncbi:MAG UNVERIFIED_CONTAM: hypothetical protein LVR18_21035 [Planctomycetaceae bacterium]
MTSELSDDQALISSSSACANTNLPSLNHGLIPGEDPNPWVDVDVFRVQFLNLTFTDDDDLPDEVQNRINNLTSDERREPIDDSTRARFGGNPPNFRFNTIATGNSTTGSGFNFWQAHFDRDYANLGELLSLPLVGPGKLTSTVGRINSSPTNPGSAPRPPLVPNRRLSSPLPPNSSAPTSPMTTARPTS